MLPRYLANLEARICGNFPKKSKNRVTFDKNCKVSCHVAEYCHNSCSKCPPFVRIHARRRPRHSLIPLSLMPNMQRCFSSQHCLDKIVCCLQRILNRNRKLKQQVSKEANCIKIGCVFKNQYTLHLRLHFLSDMPKFELLTFAR